MASFTGSAGGGGATSTSGGTLIIQSGSGYVSSTGATIDIGINSGGTLNTGGGLPVFSNGGAFNGSIDPGTLATAVGTISLANPGPTAELTTATPAMNAGTVNGAVLRVSQPSSSRSIDLSTLHAPIFLNGVLSTPEEAGLWFGARELTLSGAAFAIADPAPA